MLLVGDRINMPHDAKIVNGTVTSIHENLQGEMTYWIDVDDGENCLIIDDSQVKIINCDYDLDFS